MNRSGGLATVTPGEARRAAVAATGLARGRPARPDRRHLARLVADVHVLQLDSVNVVARAHDLAVTSRLGPAPPSLLRDAAYRRRELSEAWCHEASLVPTADLPLLQWRRDRAARRWEPWVGAHRPVIEAVTAELRDRGPLSAAQVGVGGGRRGPWWGWSDAKRALEALFARGEVAVADRAGATGFERVYDLAERVLPPHALDGPPAEPDARRSLLERAARALGIATAADLADYHRQRLTDVRPRIAELVEDGRLVPVAVDGWDDAAYLHPGAARPRRVAARALVSPFDPLVWCRPRAERLFGFRYRIEIYTPPARRVHGYYVLPFVLGDRLVARVDVKAERRSGTLLAPAAWLERGADPGEVAPALAAELSCLAGWLGLDRLAVGGRGDLAGALQQVAA